MDNCSCHKVDEVLGSIFDEANITVQFCLRSVVNGTLKAHSKRLRAEQLLNYLSVFRGQHSAMLDKPAADRVSLKWKPPKPTLVDSLSNLIVLMQNPTRPFAEDAFMEYVKRTFLLIVVLP